MSDIVVSGTLKEGKFYRANERWAKVLKLNAKRTWVTFGTGEDTSIDTRSFVQCNFAQSEAERYVKTGEYI